MKTLVCLHRAETDTFYFEEKPPFHHVLANVMAGMNRVCLITPMLSRDPIQNGLGTLVCMQSNLLEYPQEY